MTVEKQFCIDIHFKKVSHYDWDERGNKYFLQYLVKISSILNIGFVFDFQKIKQKLLTQNLSFEFPENLLTTLLAK